LDGTRVDGRPLRIEVLVGARNVPAPDPPKALKDRVAKPKNAAAEKSKTAPAKGGTKKATANGTAKADAKKSGRVGKPKRKTAEELDADMQDYFGNGTEPAAVSGAAAAAVPATNGDTGMVDEVM